jgi:hypothetical protein
VSDYVKGGIIVLCFMGLVGCHRGESIERSIENGTEIVDNPWQAPIAAPPIITPFREISQQRPDLVQYGLRSMGEFDVDGTGNIYLIGYKNESNFFYKLDASGGYSLSFGAKGQGPRELEMPLKPTVYGDRVYINEPRRKIVIFGTDGTFIEERRFPRAIDSAEPLPDGRFILFGRNGSTPPGPDYVDYSLVLSDSNFNDIKPLDTYRWFVGDKRLMPFFMWRITKDRIIVINEARSYEVLVFDFSGNLVRKIRKAFLPEHADSVIREAILGQHKSGLLLKNDYIPSPLPCMRFFIADEAGRLLIMTYQRGKSENSFSYDVFDSNGELIGQIDLDLDWSGEYLGVKKYVIKEGLFYHYGKDKEGYSIMKINKIQWPNRRQY